MPDDLTDEDLRRIEHCLPEVEEDGEASFAVTLGVVNPAAPEASFDTDDVRQLILEVRRLRQDRDRLAYHHQQAGLPPQTDDLAAAVRELQDAMDRHGLTPDRARDPAATQRLLESRCSTCAEFDGTLPRRRQN